VTLNPEQAFGDRRGVLHRDIKPANVVMDEDGEPVLTDFDIADLLFITRRTATGIGAVHYAAPEQLEGTIECAHTRRPTYDIYSLGRMLHFLLLERDPPLFVQAKHFTGLPEGLVSIRAARGRRDAEH